MKITFVLTDTGNFTSGGLRGVFQHTNCLLKKGHEVNIVYPLVPYIPKAKLNGGKLRKQASLAKWQLIALRDNLKKGKKISWFDVDANLVLIPSASPTTSAFSEKFMPDADVVLATAWETAYFVNKLSPRKGVKCYFIQHYEIWDAWNDLELWKKAEELEPDYNRAILAMNDVVPNSPKVRELKRMVDDTYRMPLNKIVISSWLKDLIEKKFGEKAYGPIINGVNFKVYFKDNSQKTSKRILMPYRGAKWKGTQDGLSAFALLRNQYPNVEFAVHGASSHENLPSWVKNYGRVSDDKLRQLYNTSYVYVVPSWVEGSQAPPLEAMACGCAVVATNVGGITDYVTPPKDLLVCPPRNPAALAEKINELLADEQKRNRIAQYGYVSVQKYTWERAATRLEMILENLTGRRVP
jgi:glycosyltransferase involved in cell wall biosynthesis